jgi:hypothetical protein
MNQTSRPQDDLRHEASYRKTFLLAIAGCALCIVLWLLVLLFFPSPWRLPGATVLSLAAMLSFIVAAGGFVVLLRHSRDGKGLPDLFALAFMRRPPDYSHGWRRSVRPLLGPALRPGDRVVVRDAAEIAATLTETRLAGLPFMPEMLAYCGRSFIVDRCIDKINDWPGGNERRRVRGVVTLLDLRCDGSQHGSCDAGCQILWNVRWLRRVPHGATGDESTRASAAAHAVPEATREFSNMLNQAASQKIVRDGETLTRYMCQNTELPRASLPMRKWDLRQDIRPLLNGNIGLKGFLVAVLTWVFNQAQAVRGGIHYPVAAPQLPALPTPSLDLGLQPGEIVRVRNKYEIGQTLYRYFNRGMWFGEETLRHCGQRYTVCKRVTRLIEERSGEMRTMKTPAIVLEGATATGEFMRFCPQNEYVFWREIWLQREGGQSAHLDSRPAAADQAESLTTGVRGS